MQVNQLKKLQKISLEKYIIELILIILMNKNDINPKLYYYTCPEALGFLEIELDEENKIKNAVFTDTKKHNYLESPELIKKTLDDYFFRNKNLPNYLISDKIEGTEFQKSVWNAIITIPFGETITYTKIAIKIGRPKASRAIGNACGKNPIALFIPCHRVVKEKSENYGYYWGKERKKWLLDLERDDL